MAATKLPESLLRSLSSLIGNILTFTTNSVERFRISVNGGWGLSGTNYGTSGQVLTSAGDAPPTWSNPLGANPLRNKIIGGDFTTNLWQRGTSFTGSLGVSTADCWYQSQNNAGTVNILKTADAPTFAQAGVYTQHCMHMDCTGTFSIISSTQSFVRKIVEGSLLADAMFGQSGTRYITLSFWVKSTKTGIHCVSIQNMNLNRSYVAEYTVNASDTWEYKSITIPVDTTGTWQLDSSGGVMVIFALATGSLYQTAGNTWTAGNFLSTANQVNTLDNTANNFKLALVQLELGATATAFESRPPAIEHNLIRRYVQKLGGNSTLDCLGTGVVTASGNVSIFIPLQVPMATPPAIRIIGGVVGDFKFVVGAANSLTGLFTPNVCVTGIELPATISGGTVGNAGILRSTNASAFFIVEEGSFK